MPGMTPSSAPLAPALRDGASPDALMSSLVDTEEALRAISSTMQAAAHRLIPPGRVDERVAQRFARAGEAWPGGGDAAPPTPERQAELLAALDDARASLRAAAECCRRAREILASTVHASGVRPSDPQG
jgi:hypothetical protein